MNKLVSLLIALLIFLSYLASTQAQTNTTFTPDDKFSIPEFNTTISFAVNGSYSEARLENDTWIFKDLTLDNPPITADLGLNVTQGNGDLIFSTQDSNVTILAYLTFNYTFPVTLLSYTVEGEGKQKVNFDLNLSRPTDPSEWSIILPNNAFLTEGDGWNLLPNDTLLITCATSNLTVAHFNFINSIDNNLFFYMKHSVIISTAVILAVIVTIATTIRLRARKKKKHI